MKYSAVIVAAGSSKRFKAGENKLLYTLDDGNRVIDHTLAVFKADPDCDQIVVVVNSEVGNYLFSKKNTGKVVFCYGGKSRAESVYHGLMAVTCENVFVHDGARCFLNIADLNVLKEEFEKSGACILCRKVTDTIKTVDEDGYIVSTIDRETLRGAQTPQAFKTDLLIDCYEKAFKEGVRVTDDASAVEAFSDVKIKCVESVTANIKITTIDDVR